MKFQMEICSDCSVPPNWVAVELPAASESDCRRQWGVKCRDCGDSWVESEEED